MGNNTTKLNSLAKKHHPFSQLKPIIQYQASARKAWSILGLTIQLAPRMVLQLLMIRFRPVAVQWAATSPWFPSQPLDRRSNKTCRELMMLCLRLIIDEWWLIVVDGYWRLMITLGWWLMVAVDGCCMIIDGWWLMDKDAWWLDNLSEWCWVSPTV